MCKRVRVRERERERERKGETKEVSLKTVLCSVDASGAKTGD